MRQLLCVRLGLAHCVNGPTCSQTGHRPGGTGLAFRAAGLGPGLCVVPGRVRRVRGPRRTARGSKRSLACACQKRVTVCARASADLAEKKEKEKRKKVSGADLGIPLGDAPVPARPGQPCPPRIGPVKLTIAETARLTSLARQHAAGLITSARLAFRLRWPRWRRRHQARA